MDVNAQLIKLRSRLTLPEYISLHLLAGLAITVACLWFFAHMVSEVIVEQEFNVFDTAVANELHVAATPAATRFFEFVSAFGFQALGVIAIVVAAYFLWKRQWLYLGIWIAALVGGEILNLLLKQWFARPRPSFSDPLIVAKFFSFPSGHATLSLIAYGLLAYFLYSVTSRRWLRIPVAAALILLTLLIGVSRIYLGVHYFSDVVAGFAIGGLWLSFCITAMHFLHDRHAYRHPPQAPVDVPLTAENTEDTEVKKEI